MSRIRNLEWFADEFFSLASAEKAPIKRMSRESNSFSFAVSSEHIGKAMEQLTMAFTAVWGGPGSFFTRIYASDELVDSDDNEVLISVMVMLP